MNKVKITSHQLKTITFTNVCGAAVFVVSSSVCGYAKQDAWLSAILSAWLGFIVLYINTSLGERYPDKTFIEVIRLLLGRSLGGIVGISFVLMCFIITVQEVWYVGDFITTKFMPETPVYAINGLFTAGVVIALLYGLEAAARATEVFFYIILFVFISSMLLLTPNIKTDNILPVLENGLIPVFKGIVPLYSIMVLPLILLNMIYPVNVTDIKKSKRSLLYGYILGAFVSLVSIIMTVLVLGSTITADLRFPVFMLITEMHIGEIFTRMEAVIVIVWILAIFICAVFYFYSAALGLSQILKLREHKKIIVPMALIIFILSGSIYKNVPYQIFWDNYVWVPYIATYGLVLPVILLAVSEVKRKSGC